METLDPDLTSDNATPARKNKEFLSSTLRWREAAECRVSRQLKPQTGCRSLLYGAGTLSQHTAMCRMELSLFIRLRGRVPDSVLRSAHPIGLDPLSEHRHSHRGK